MVFKNFPLRSHKYATTAAAAALAADRQGKFWEFHDELFKVYNQLSDEKISEIAQILALNLDQFEKDIKDLAIMESIRQDYQEGLRIGIKGIPTVYINGKRFTSRRLNEFQSAIEKELKKSSDN
jgi:protein-disulfide isomerase